MKKMTKKIPIGLGGVMALILSVLLAGMPAFAEENRVPDLESNSCSIALTFAADNKTYPLSGAEFCIDRIADLKVRGGGAVYTLTKDYQDTGVAFDGMSVEDSDQAARACYEVAKTKQDQGILHATTDQNGTAVFSDLTPGAYLVWEERAESGTAKDYSLCNPFLVLAPEYDSAQGTWRYQTAAYPKSSVTKKSTESTGENPGSSGGSSDTGSTATTTPVKKPNHTVKGATRSFTATKEVLLDGKSVDGTEVPAGSSVVFRIRVTNNTGKAQDVEFGDSLQGGITFVSTESPNFVQDGDALHWKLPAVPDGGEAYVEFTAALPKEPGTYSNSAFVLVDGVTQQTNTVTCTVGNGGEVLGANRNPNETVPETGAEAASRQTSDNSMTGMYVLIVIAGATLLAGILLSGRKEKK